MADALERVLRLVADGRLTAVQAAPILDALAAADEAVASADRARAATAPRTTDEGLASRAARSIRIEVTANGRKTINLRIPVSLGRMALDRIPGLSGTHADLVRQALAEGRSGTLLDIDEEGSGVRIALE